VVIEAQERQITRLYKIGFGPRGDNLISDCNDMRACEVVIVNSAPYLLITANLTGDKF